MLRRERGASGKLPHLFIPSKIATLVHDFAVEDLPLGRTACSARRVLGQKTLMMIMNLEMNCR